MKEKFDSKYQEETIILTFDYSKLLAAGETIDSAEWTVSVIAGVDANPSAMLSGAIAINGSNVSHKILGGIEGVSYQMRAKATTSLVQILILVADIDVVPLP